MYALIVAIILGFYWFVRVSSDKHATRMSNELMDRHFANARMISDQIVLDDPIKLREFDDYLKDRNNRQQIVELLHENFVAALGENYEEVFKARQKPCARGIYPKGRYYWERKLLLAKRGKVEWGDEFSGFYLEYDEYRDQSIRLLQQVEKNLRDAGRNVRLVCPPGEKTTDPDRWNPRKRHKMIFEYKANPHWQGDPRSYLW